MIVEPLTIPGEFRVRASMSGPQVVCFGGVHGDEPSGVAAIERLKGELEEGRIHIEHGTLTLVTANQRALERDVRFLDDNLNRLFREGAGATQSYEALRAQELKPILKHCDFFLDLHSTSSESEPFMTCERKLLDLARKFAVKNIVVGWGELEAEGIKGDTETFALNHGAVAFTMECGQHRDPKAKEVAYYTLLKFLQFSGLLPDDREPHPKQCVYQLFHVEICSDKDFKFSKPYTNFTPLKKGEVIGRDANTQYLAPKECVLVLPAYRERRVIGEQLYFLADRES